MLEKKNRRPGTSTRSKTSTSWRCRTRAQPLEDGVFVAVTGSGTKNQDIAKRFPEGHLQGLGVLLDNQEECLQIVLETGRPSVKAIRTGS